jgi:hypothetical protein
VAVSRRETTLRCISTILGTPSLGGKVNSFAGKFERKILINGQEIMGIHFKAPSGRHSYVAMTESLQISCQKENDRHQTGHSIPASPIGEVDRWLN